MIFLPYSAQSSLIGLINLRQLIERKKDLVESCRILIDELKEKEGEAAITARKAFNDIESSIDQEKRSFRSGHEDRLQKVSSTCFRVINLRMRKLHYLKLIEPYRSLSLIPPST